MEKESENIEGGDEEINKEKTPPPPIVKPKRGRRKKTSPAKEGDVLVVPAPLGEEVSTPTPSSPPQMRYCILQETNDMYQTQYLYFIKYDGNEKALEKLHSQLEAFEQALYEGMCVFELRLNPLVSEATAKEMCRMRFSGEWYRKFDGSVKTINLKLKKKDSRREKMKKLTKLLGFGKVTSFLSNEDEDAEFRDAYYAGLKKNLRPLDNSRTTSSSRDYEEDSRDHRRYKDKKVSRKERGKHRREYETYDESYEYE